MRTLLLTSVAALVPAAASGHEIAEPHQHGGELFWIVVLSGAVAATALLLWLRNKTRARD